MSASYAVASVDAVALERGEGKGIKLEWSDITYSVAVKKGKDVLERKTLLKPMSGEALPGELLAIMGTSGAGKSTLLDVLAARLESRHLKGTITANGTPIDPSSFRKLTGYVMQNDALFPLLTVRETFQFAAYLRIHDMSRSQKDQAAENIIKLLRLEKCADTIIGDDDHRGLSGGERRRVSIGVDIIHTPAVVFLDEPTSGLDSSTALSVVESLKQLATEQQCTVVMTIHQPSARLFDLIDKVTFLADGNVTYSGLVVKLLPHIKSAYKEANLGETPVVNPPELFLDLCDKLRQEGRLELLTDKFRTDKVQSAPSALTTDDDEAVPLEANYANSLLGDVSILSRRALINVTRTPELFVARLGATVFFGVMIGTLFLFTSDDTRGLQFRVAYFIFTLAFYYWTSLEALPIFLAEREIFQREYSRGAYRAAAYTLASSVVFYPFLLLIAAMYTIVTWWLIGLDSQADKFFWHILVIFSTLVAGNAFATMFSVLVPNPMTGQTAGSGLFSVMMLYSGFFIKREDIPAYWIWLHYLSLFKYSYDSMVASAFAGVDTPTMTNAAVLEYFGVDGVDKGTGVGVLWLFIIFFRLVFYYRLVTAFNGSRK